MNGWPVTNYDIWQMKKASVVIAVAVAGVLVMGNIIAALLVHRVKVNPASYTLNDGFPRFESAKDYISMVRSYPHDMGTRVKIHTMRPGESYWDVARQFSISIDTIIAANPFLGSLMAREGTDIVVPLKDGVLIPVDNMWDARRMKKRLEYEGGIRGDYIQSVFRMISLDDMRFAFFPNARPYMVNPGLQALYNIRRIYQNPIKHATYTSLYGDRVNPTQEGMEFHNGVDIISRMGSNIHPVREGMVAYTGWNYGYGLTVAVLHTDGYFSMYGHCSKINVKPGDWVEKKNVIGTVGSTGRSTGPHLHFMMMRHGQMLNPLLFIW